jgi:hypothetical protein
MLLQLLQFLLKVLAWTRIFMASLDSSATAPVALFPWIIAMHLFACSVHVHHNPKLDWARASMPLESLARSVLLCIEAITNPWICFCFFPSPAPKRDVWSCSWSSFHHHHRNRAELNRSLSLIMDWRNHKPLNLFPFFPSPPPKRDVCSRSWSSPSLSSSSSWIESKP